MVAFGMLSYRSWEIKTARTQNIEAKEFVLPELPFRHLEKNMLYLAKYVIQSLVIILAKYWFITITKFKKWFDEKWPKINAYFKKKTDSSISYRHSFLKKAILESKAKIKHIRKKVKEEIGEEEEKKEE
jgi:hypothetical protein